MREKRNVTGKKRMHVNEMPLHLLNQQRKKIQDDIFSGWWMWKEKRLLTFDPVERPATLIYGTLVDKKKRAYEERENTWNIRNH